MWFNQYPYINLNDLNLDWLLKHMKELLAALDELETWRAEHEQEYEELYNFMVALENGELTPKMYDALIDWLQKNMLDIVGDMVKFITVALDGDYIVFRLPSHWSEIVFNTTGLDINTPIQPEYGHLTISY